MIDCYYYGIHGMQYSSIATEICKILKEDLQNT